MFNKMVRFFKKILKHVAEYCEQAAIHGPQHIVAERLTIFERLVVLSKDDNMRFVETSKVWHS